MRNSRGEKLIGWASKTHHSKSVLLLHGIRSDSRSMLNRACFFRDTLQYNVILFDQRAHGLSEGDYSSAGLYESMDLQLFENYINEQYGTSMGVVGISMGGAAAVLALDIIDPDFLILEMVYPTLDEAISNRLKKRLGPFAPVVKHGMYLILKIRYNMEPVLVNPVEAAKSYDGPVQVLAGGKDKRTTKEESENFYNAFPKDNKKLHIFPEAAHEDLYSYDSTEYKEIVRQFLRVE